MKVSEEVDAMAAMGLDRTRFLVTPKVVALLIMLPLLTLYADLVGIVGGLVVAVVQLNIPAVVYFANMKYYMTSGTSGRASSRPACSPSSSPWSAACAASRPSRRRERRTHHHLGHRLGHLRHHPQRRGVHGAVQCLVRRPPPRWPSRSRTWWRATATGHPRRRLVRGAARRGVRHRRRLGLRQDDAAAPT